MLYEFYDKAAPRGINGFPIFYSVNIVSKIDSDRFLEMYKKYEEARINFEKDFK